MQNKFKIVFLRLNPAATGGAERYLSRLKQALENSKIKSQIRSYKGSLKLSSWIKALIFERYAKKEKRGDELYFSLERISSADIYRAGDGVHKIYRASKPFWWLNPLNFVYPYLEKKCFNNSIKIIANSKFVAKQIQQCYDISDEKISIIYNGVNLPTSINKPEAKAILAKEFGLNASLNWLLFVGSGFKRKGVSRLLEIASKLVKNGAKIELIIIGKDKQAQKYIKHADSLGLGGIAHFLGQRSDVARFYEASDIFVFPTFYEPFSNVVLEALSYGCVSFSTPQNGASEILEDEFVLKDDSVSVIERYVNDKELLGIASKRAFDLAKNFSIEKNAKDSLLVIQEVIGIKANMIK